MPEWDFLNNLAVYLTPSVLILQALFFIMVAVLLVRDRSTVEECLQAIQKIRDQPDLDPSEPGNGATITVRTILGRARQSARSGLFDANSKTEVVFIDIIEAADRNYWLSNYITEVAFTASGLFGTMCGIVLAFRAGASNEQLFQAIGLACMTTLFGTFWAALTLVLGAKHEKELKELERGLQRLFLRELAFARSGDTGVAPPPPVPETDESNAIQEAEQEERE